MVATIVQKVDRRLFIVFLVLCLISTTALLPPLPQAEGGNIQPILRQMAASQPETIVGVIVQKAGNGHSPEELVRLLGGEVTKDLRIINAFAAELPAGEVERFARDPGVRWVSFDAPVIRQGDPATYITWATAQGTSLATHIKDAAYIYDSYTGPNGSYGYGGWKGGKNQGAFGGFTTLELYGKIEKVEAVFYLYLSAPLGDDFVSVRSHLDGTPSSLVSLSADTLNNYVGKEKAGYLYLDLTATRAWSWENFNRGLELQIEHRRQGKDDGAAIYYDAVGYQITFNTTDGVDEPSEKEVFSEFLSQLPGLDAVIKEASGDQGADRAWLKKYLQSIKDRRFPWRSDGTIDLSNLANAYVYAIGAPDLWNSPARLQGQEVTVAVVDSGVLWSPNSAKISDLGDGFPPRQSRLLKSVVFNRARGRGFPIDDYGHGTHIAGIIGGNGLLSWGKYIGVAPRVNLVSVKVSDAQGMGYESDVVAGLQWIYEHEDEYNIRVVNISLNSSVPQSYHTSPLDAAVEILWFNEIVVMVSAGNNAVDHNGILYPPANDPFVITVGATDDQGTPDVGDDLLANFSAFGTTEEGVAKPDLVAPGRNIVSISPGPGATLVREHPDHKVDLVYFRMSGTSMASAVTSGAVALLLQAQPDLNPDQVKWRLMHTTQPFPVEGAGAGYLNVRNAVNSGSTETANTGQEVSQLLWTGPEPPIWDSVHWDSVHWDSVHWDSVHWDSVHWDSVHWDNVYWGDPVYSSSISWD